MHIVYVLQEDKGRFYKGLTNNLARRFSEHNRGETITTSKMHGLKIVHTEKYDSFEKARAREVYLKSAAGRRFLKNKLRL